MSGAYKQFIFPLDKQAPEMMDGPEDRLRDLKCTLAMFSLEREKDKELPNEVISLELDRSKERSNLRLSAAEK